MDSDAYHIILEGAQGEITEKKSRFISYVSPVSSQEEALAYVESIKKKHYDARHNCYAFVTDGGNVVRYSDDGEPQGTAGKPILEVISGADLRDVVIVVTRYFGGTLLGTGGLVRAYTASAQDGLKNSVIGSVRHGVTYRITTDYNGIGKIKFFLSTEDVKCEEPIYSEVVSINVSIPSENKDRILKQITELTLGKAQTELICEGYLRM